MNLARLEAHRRSACKALQSLQGEHRRDDGIDALDLSIEMRPDLMILVTGDADFAYLAIKLRRHGIRVEVASVAANLGRILRSAANDVIDLTALFRTFEMINTREARRSPASGHEARSPRRAGMRG